MVKPKVPKEIKAELESKAANVNAQNGEWLFQGVRTMEKVLTAGTTALILAIGATFVGCAGNVEPEKPSETKESPMAVITEVGELGENIYDLAKAKDWGNVVAKLTVLKKEAESLRSQIKDASEAKDQLSHSITALGESTKAKDEQATMQEANRITLIAADLTEPLHLQVPVEITRLDYYGRELEIWSAAKNNAKLKGAADALHETWDKVQPSVKAHGGTAEAKTFDGP